MFRLWATRGVRFSTQAAAGASHSGLKDALVALNATCIDNSRTKLSFKTLLQEMEAQKAAYVPEPVVSKINDALHTLLESASAADRRYYLTQLKNCSNWMHLYSLIYDERWIDSLQFVRSHGADIPNGVLVLLLESVLAKPDRFRLKLFLAVYDTIEPKEAVGTPVLDRFLRLCIESHSTNVLAKFFEKYILYTGANEAVKSEVLLISNERLEQMIGEFRAQQNVKAYSKTVAYYMERMKRQRGQLGKYNELRFQSRLDKFNMYLDKLGPYKVLENGMFDQFKFTHNTRIKLDSHLLHFTDELTKEYTANRTLTTEEALLLVELMHGLHVQPHAERFSRKLNPDIQMARVYRNVIRKTTDPDPITLQNYNRIIAMASERKYTHLKDGLPTRRTLNQRLDPTATAQTRFYSLPLEIVLRVLYNLAQQDSDFPTTQRYITTAVLLFQTMIEKHGLSPSRRCFHEFVNCVQLLPQSRQHLGPICRLYRVYHKGGLKIVDPKTGK